MRILFWNQSYLPRRGGVETFTGRLAEELLSRGDEPMVVTYRHQADEPDEEMVEGVPVHRFDFARALDVRADPRAAIREMSTMTRRIGALKKRLRPDIVHVNFSDGSPIFHLRSSPDWPCPTILSFHAGLSRSPGDTGVTNMLLKHAAQVTVVSEFAAEDLISKSGLSRDRIELITPGAAALRFEAPGGHRGPADILFIGRLVPGKGADIAIRAMKELDEGIILTIVGDGPERDRLEGLVAALELGKQVRFLGELNTRLPIPVQPLALVVPSEHELFGIVAVEAALSGVPVIASAVGGLPEIVEDGVTGYLVAPRDPGAIAIAVRRLVAEPQLALTMGQAGRVKALQSYTVDRMFDSFYHLYRQCLAE